MIVYIYTVLSKLFLEILVKYEIDKLFFLSGKTNFHSGSPEETTYQHS